ncbi:MAG TPA: beta-ketoacyl synthase N-terminal-like domain-containing protein [Myxococcota bacterium]|nr:beta-ketoacyl synthase N-terminal-like domain-containing protein [Myxococcota bacterium]HQK50837.1 beta-ketoacyl synthase N-terminal-like domain-containing protein [Myxococcota bacterium]
MVDEVPRISGMAACCALGGDVRSVWRNLLEGASGLAPDRTGTVVGAMPHDPWDADGDPWAACIAGVARRAIEDSGADPARALADPTTGLVVATTKGDIEGLRLPGRPVSLGPFLRRVRTAMDHRGPAELVSAACASGAAAIVRADRLIRGGVCRRVLVVGADRLDPFLVEGFRCLGAMAAGPCRPYDDEREGLSLGEAVAALWIEGGPGPGVRLAGAGQAQDAVGMVRPDPSGGGLARAIRQARTEARGGPVGAICGHGTATEANDAMEAEAFRSAFGDSPPPVFGIKGATGHTLGACGTLEALVSAMALEAGLVPPTAGHRAGSLGLDICRFPRPLSEGRILSVNSGFGGLNVALILEASR